MQTDKESYYEFDCGCKFKTFGNTPKDIDDLPPIEVDFYNLRDCPKVWSVFENGNTKGVFQLESQLGQDWSSKLKPESLDDLAALTALIRPGSLESEIDGKSMTQAYVNRKHGLNDPIPPHPALENAYKNTYGVSCFQEQNILAVQEVAGFTESEAEKYRKAVGKKLVDVMAELHPKFVDGCVKNGLSKDEAEKIFQILKAAERYSFNASHATTYGYTSYATAYYKYHFPLHFYTSWLTFAKEKIDPKEEMRELITDAKRAGLSVLSPTIFFLTNGHGSNFFTKNGNIYFGLSNIKGVGDKEICKLIKSLKDSEKVLKKPESEWSWFEFLSQCGDSVNKTVMNNLISVGATPGIESRKAMLLDYKIFHSLNEKERIWIKNNFRNFDSLKDSLKAYLVVPKASGGPYNSKSVEKLEKLVETLSTSPYNRDDDIDWIASNELYLMGTSLSSHKVDDYFAMGDSTCKELFEGKDMGSVVGLIVSVKETVTKKGKNPGQKMCFLKIDDKTDTINCTCFPNVYEKHSDIIYDGSVVLAKLERSKLNQRDFIVNSISRA